MIPPAEFRPLLATPDSPHLGPQPRAGTVPLAELNRRVEAFLEGRKLAEPLPTLVRAAALLWHDHLEAAHELAQQLDSADGSLLHGIMHRREPDYDNAKYWFRRAGQHPAYALLAKELPTALADDPALLGRLTPRGRWDPFAFVDACSAVATQPPTSPQVLRLRAVQSVELLAVLTHFFQTT